MRKWLAGRLIRLAHRIYPPQVTVHYVTSRSAQELLERMATQWN